MQRNYSDVTLSMGKTNKAYYIDSFCADGEHEVFNAASLCMFAHVYDKISYYGGSHSLKCMARIIREYPINSRCHTIYTLRKRHNTKLRYVVSFLHNLRFLLFAPRHVTLIYNYTNPLFLKTANALNKIFRRKILVTCHGEMDGLRAKVRYSSREKWVRNFFLDEKLTPDRNIHYLVLGESILRNLRPLLLPAFQSRFLSVDHPYIDSATEKYESVGKNKIRIGTIGIPAGKKGIDSVIRLATVNQKNNCYEFSLNGYIGHIGDRLETIRKAGIEMPDTSEFLSRAELAARIGRLDYALFLYPPEEYELTASGSILEAINYEKPVLSLRNDYFSYLFEKFGAFGVLFDSVDEMIAALSSEIPTFPLHDQFDFKALKQRLSPERIAAELRSTLQTHKII